jgi:hypothetical protein
MEWTAIKRATEAGRYDLNNRNDASNPHTPAPLESDCREYLETISVLMTTLGYPVLEPVREIRLTGPDGDGGAETLVFREGGTDARASPTTEGLLVLAGSVGKATHRPSLSSSLVRRRQDLVEQGVVEIRGDEYVFVKDQLFSSPSTAGAVVVGGNINGRITWKTARGKTFQQLEDEALS